MKKLILIQFIFLCNFAYGQMLKNITPYDMCKNKNLMGVSITTSLEFAFLNWIKTDSSLYIYETIIYRNGSKETNYWWSIKLDNEWVGNLELPIDNYIKGTEKSNSINWCNLPKINKIISFDINYNLFYY